MYVEKARPDRGDVESMADTYHRLHAVLGVLPEDEDLRVRAALAAVGDALTVAVQKSQPVPLTYGEELVEKAVTDLAGSLEEESVDALVNHFEGSGPSGEVLKSFDQADTVGRVSLDAVQRPPPVALPSGVITDFSQVSETAPVQKTAVDGELAVFQEFLDRIAKTDDASLEEKQEAIRKVGKAMVEKMASGVAGPDGVSYLVDREVAKATQPLAQRIEELERLLAVVKSQVGEEPPGGDPPHLVRKSIVPVSPSRRITKGGERPTFVGLVRGDQYGGGAE